jgi:hypothetical protein
VRDRKYEETARAAQQRRVTAEQRENPRKLLEEEETMCAANSEGESGRSKEQGRLGESGPLGVPSLSGEEGGRAGGGR